MDDEKMRILMMGNTMAGKTSYLLSTFGVLKKGKSGFRIGTDPAMDQYLTLAFKSLKKGSYPLSTDSLHVYPFELSYYGKTMMSFEIVDSGDGGVLREPGAAYLLEELGQADAIMLFFDASALLHNNRKAHQFQRIVTLLSHRLMEEEGPLCVTIVITKYDTVGDQASLEKVCTVLKPFTDILSQKENIRFRMFPVSCTENGFFNVDLPILDILYSRVEREYCELQKRLELYTKNAQEYDAQKGVEDWMLSKLARVDSYGKMAKNAKKSAQETAALLQPMKEPYEKLGEYIRAYRIVLPKRGQKEKAGLRAIFDLFR